MNIFSQTKIIFLSLCLLVQLPLSQTGCDAPEDPGQPHLTDKELMANLHAHKLEFQKLVAMILEDKDLTRVDEDWTDPKNPQTVGISPQRIAEYRKMFPKLGIPRGFSAAVDKSEIEFIASSQGFVTHGSSKGYVYGKCPNWGTVVEDLDVYSIENKRTETVCRKIEEKWYLYFESD